MSAHCQIVLRRIVFCWWNNSLSALEERIPDQIQDQLGADAFLKGLQNKNVAYEVINRDPCSLAESQQRVASHEHNFRATVGQETESRNRVRHVSRASDTETCEDTTTSARWVQTPQHVTTGQFAALTDQVETLVCTVEGLQLHVGHIQTTYKERQWTGMMTPPSHLKFIRAECALNLQAQPVEQLVHALSVKD